MQKCCTKILIVFMVVLSCFSTQAQTVEKTLFVVKENTLQKFSFDNVISDYSIDTNSGYFTIAVSSDYSVVHNVGNPSLPVIQKILAIPIDAKAIVEIEEDIVEEYSLWQQGIYQKMYPIQPSQFKNRNNNEWHINNKIYYTNSYYKNELVELSYMGTMRGVQLVRLTISPFEYNPAQNKLRIHTFISAEVKITDINKNKVLRDIQSTSSAYYNMMNNSISNTKAYTNALLSSNDVPLKYVVVARESFREALQPFIEWKKQQGFDMVEYYPHSDANRDTIRAKLSDMYHSRTPLDHAPTFLLIVGDVEHIHSFVGKYTLPGGSTHATDLYYAEYTGDIYPDVLYGRISVSDTTQLKAVISKTIEYEKYNFTDKSMLNKTLLVAGKETREPAPTVTNGQLNYLKTTLTDYFNVDTVCFYNGNSHNQKEDILNQLSSIPGFVNYSGHCTAAGWSSPYITATDVDTFSSQGTYSFVVNNCCKSSNFSSGVCFGEALLRKPNAGAIGVIGASNETLWNEDYYWGVGAKYPFSVNPVYDNGALGAFDRMFHARNENICDYVITQGQMLQAGNMAVAQAGSPYENYYWEIYNLLGDPSLMPYIGTPDTMNIIFNDTIRMGDITIQCNGSPMTHISIYEDTLILGSTFINQNGNGTINLCKPITSNKMLTVATAQYLQPIIDTINVSPATGAKVVLCDYYLTDTIENIIHKVSPGQEIHLYGRLMNISNNDAHNINFVLDNIIEGIVVSDTLFLDTIPADTFYEGLLAKIIVDNGVQNSSIFSLNTVVCDTSIISKRKVEMIVSASEIKQNSVEFKDMITNKSVNVLQPDSTYILEVAITNIGKHYSDSIFVSLCTNNLAVVLSDSLVAHPSLQVGDTTTVIFTLKISNIVDTALCIKLGIRERNNYSETTSYYAIGRAVETFERGNFTLLEWDTLTVFPWQIDSTIENSHKGIYSARSAKIQGRQLSVLKLPLEVISDDTVSFWVKTSTEQNYDILTFYIDGESKGSWSGRKDWKCYKFPITKGKHQVMWKYQKDDETNSGSDAVWIDDLELPISRMNTPFVPNDNEVNIDIESETFAGKIYPNPAENYVVFEFDTNQKTNVYIYNSNGIMVESLEINNCKMYKYNTVNYKSGIYTVVLKNDKNILIEKMIIMK